MKILYGVQGTGNGHLSRAVEVIPALKRHGHVDVLVSGYQSELRLPHQVAFRRRGLSFVFGKKGGIDLRATLRRADLETLRQEIDSAPVAGYDLIVNDFEPVTAWACRQQGIPCFGISHQAAVLRPESPKPKNVDPLGRRVLQHYAPTSADLGFHFSAYGPGISTPVIKQDIRALCPERLGHYTVYLPAYGDDKLLRLLGRVNAVEWHVFSKHARSIHLAGNVTIRPVSQGPFLESLRTCTGVLCGAGFELPSEALFLGKKLLAIPMRGQYEQQCNAAALRALGVETLKKLSPKRLDRLRHWVAHGQVIHVAYPDVTQALIDELVESHRAKTFNTRQRPIGARPEEWLGSMLLRGGALAQRWVSSDR